MGEIDGEEQLRVVAFETVEIHQRELLRAYLPGTDQLGELGQRQEC